MKLALAVIPLVFLGASQAALLAHWTFDEGSGTTAADSSGNGLTAELAGAPGSWVTGQAGSGYELGQSDSRFELADSSSLQVTGSVTVAAWVKPFGESNFGVIAGIDQTGGTASDMYSLKTDARNNLTWQVIGADGNVNLVGGNLSALSNGGADWIHVAGVCDPENNFAALYVNGVEVASTPTVPDSIQSVNTPFQIGHNASDSGGFPFLGAVDEVRVYDEALSESDLAELAEGSPGDSAPVLDLAHDGASGEFTFTWNAEEGKSYQILGNADLASDPVTWTVVPGLSDVTSPQSLVLSGDDRFFVVQEAP